MHGVCARSEIQTALHSKKLSHFLGGFVCIMPSQGAALLALLRHACVPVVCLLSVRACDGPLLAQSGRLLIPNSITLDRRTTAPVKGLPPCQRDRGRATSAPAVEDQIQVRHQRN